MTTSDLSRWTARPRPPRKNHEGRYTRLEPLDAVKHGDELFAASSGPKGEPLWTYLGDGPFKDRASFQPWLEKTSASEDPLFFAIIDRATGRVEGRQTLMRIDPGNGVIEIGNIFYGPNIARTRVATEAFYLFAAHIFEDLGYRRFEWKCNNENVPSKNAAARFGFTFEGIFRQHMVVKAKNRDTAWYSMLDHEWPACKRAFQDWLAPENFASDGRQKTKLGAGRA
jgi:RimJ/RimL family protein N-acetyltransferase